MQDIVMLTLCKCCLTPKGVADHSLRASALDKLKRESLSSMKKIEWLPKCTYAV